MMVLFCSKTNQAVTLTVSIAHSGEGEVWQTDCAGLLAKIYHVPASNEKEKLAQMKDRVAKLEVMVKRVPKDPNAHQNHISFAWPRSLLKNSGGEVVGFLMPEVENSLDLLKVCTPRMRKKLGVDANWYFLHVVARNIAGIIQAIHDEGYVLGDIKLQNILVNNRALPTIIDTDSFQVVDPIQNKVYRCLVASEGFTPSELIGKDIDSITQSAIHDRFRLGVVIYYLLFGGPPFRGSWQGSGDPPEQVELIRRGFWPYAPNSLIQPNNNTIPLDIIHSELQRCFLLCFNDGHFNPSKRPSARVWLEALEVAFNELQSCGKVDSHFYGLSYGRCYWCDRAQNLGVDIFQGNLINYSNSPIIAVFSRMRGNKILEKLTVQDSNTPHSCDYRYNSSQPISSQQVNHAKSLIDSNTFSKIQKRLIALYPSVSILLKNNRLFHKLKSHIYWKKLIGFLSFLVAIISIFIYWNFTTNANYYFLKAIDYDRSNKYAEAILNYDKAIEINPNNADYYYNRGNSYYYLKNYNEAILNYNRAIRINPDNVDYYYNRGNSYYYLKNYNEAILTYNKAIEINPNNADYYYNRGLSYYYLSQYNKAIVNYDETIKINPKNADYYNERGKSYHRLGKYDKAMSNYHKATKINPNNNEAISNYDKAKKEKLSKGAYNKAKVTWPGGLSLRSNPSKDSERVGGAEYNSDLIVLETSADGDWAKVRSVNGGQEGWVKVGNFTKLTPSNKINIDDEFLPHKRKRSP